MIRASAKDAKPGKDFLPLRPGKLYSLWDMIQFFVHQFAMDWQRFLVILRHYEDVGVRTPGVLATPEEIQHLAQIASRIRNHCIMLELPISLNRVHTGFENRLDSGICFNAIIMSELQELHKSINVELDNRKYVLIPQKKVEYFNNRALFGTEVSEAFPFDVSEIIEIGNCLAAELHTAAAFHLMRIVEIGLRELARNLNVKIKKTPLDYAGWQAVVKAIDDKLRDLSR